MDRFFKSVTCPFNLQGFQLAQSRWRIDPSGLSGCLWLRRSSLSFSFACATLVGFDHRPPGATYAASRIRPELVQPYPVRALGVAAGDIAPAP